MRLPFSRALTRASVLAVAAALPVGALRAQAKTPDDRPTIAVMYFSNAALVKHDEYEPLSKGMAEMLITELSANPALHVIEREQLQKLLDEQNLGGAGRVDQATAVKIGKLLGARHMLFGGFVIDFKNRMRLDLRSVDAETSTIEYVQSLTGNADNVLDLIAELGGKVSKGLKLPPNPTGTARPASLPAPSGGSAPKGDQLRSVVLMGRAMSEQDKGNNAGAIALYEKSIEAYPDNPRAKEILAQLKAKGGN
ncbi:MAG: CsgG/HfaB family protein [Gemmatimonadota bacterium]|nr:CsgG/HfaB family protein [Gemmatimonadota bacterium]